jgi:hypothetical protein
VPVLHYDRCAFDVNTIQRGRLYFETRYVHNMDFVQKPEEFIAWADHIIKAVRRRLKRHTHEVEGRAYIEYVGEHALNWIKENKAVYDAHRFRKPDQS